jgi:Rab GDP dissociation inhibitor
MAEEKRGEWDYDIILVGTSLKECFLSGLLAAVDKKKILHLDRNDYYGGESASFNLQQIVAKFAPPDSNIDQKALGRSSDYSVDASPKFLMGKGTLVECLRKLIPEDYLRYQKIQGSFVYHEKALHKVPTTANEGLNSGLLGFTQKFRFRGFVNFVDAFDENDTKTHSGYNMKTMTMGQIYNEFSLDKTSQTFISHALALQCDDKHLNELAVPILKRIKLYAQSLLIFQTSPYVYPQYGLGGLAESFSRLSSIYGCTFITGCDVKAINYGEDGSFSGLTFSHPATGEISATAKKIIGDPSYFAPEKSRKVAQIARSICILSAPVGGATADCQIILPGTNCKRASDIYLSCLSHVTGSCPDGKYIAVCSTTVNGAACADLNNVQAMSEVCSRELAHAYGLFSRNILQKFEWVTEQREPVADTSAQGVWMTQSFDATSHFQSVMDEIFSCYQSVTGKEFDIKALRSTQEAQEEEQARATAEYQARQAAEGGSA